MISDTLRSVAAVPNWSKVAQLAAEKKLGLVELGRHTGLSAAMLSKIERGPTLPTLLQIAMVFNVELEHFFVPDTGRPQVAVIRKPDRLGSRTGPVLSRRPICLRASITRSPIKNRGVSCRVPARCRGFRTASA